MMFDLNYIMKTFVYFVFIILTIFPESLRTSKYEHFVQ